MSEISGPISLIDVPGMTLHPLGGSPGYRLYQCGDGLWLFLGTLFPHFFRWVELSWTAPRPPERLELKFEKFTLQLTRQQFVAKG